MSEEAEFFKSTFDPIAMQRDEWQARAQKAEEACRGQEAWIEQVTGNLQVVQAAHLKTEADRKQCRDDLHRAIEQTTGWRDRALKAEAEVEHKRERIVSLGDQFATEHLARIKAEEALRDLLNWINPHCGIPASVIDRARAALSEKGG